MSCLLLCLGSQNHRIFREGTSGGDQVKALCQGHLEQFVKGCGV